MRDSSCAALLGVLLAAIPGRSHAEDPVAEIIGAQAFAERYRSEGPRFQALEADLEAERAAVTEASLWPNPRLSLQREEVFPGDGDGLAENTLALGWAIDFSGRRSRRTAAVRAAVRAARARADAFALEALIEGLGTFYDAAHARLRAEALREGRAPLARMVEAVRRRVAAGDAAAYDLSRLELELAAYDERLLEARTELDAARRALAGLLGEPGALYDAGSDLALPAVPGRDELVAAALAARGDYRATGFEAKSAKRALSAAERGWVPILEPEIGVKTADLGTETATGYYAQLSLELPLFSRGQAAAERARARQRAARARRALLERRIATEVRVAHARLAAAARRAETYRTAQLERAQALVRQAESIYQSGEGSVIELLDAYRAAARARVGYLDLLRRARAAELSLSLALGRLPELR